ncbi:MAG: dUTP diphosphatase [Alphaproteobacteria bacterium]|jgi:dUTP pyrophosphatase|nr:dUTP diphosphatase [Alphaproteobacteria bacterium]|tara:strand:+ start:125 stop:574 length:450 start_codon:yes stop_codon:yes gene_type:complete
MIAIPVQRLAHASGLALPERATVDSAGMDLLAAVGGEVVLAPGGRALIPTGIALALPSGYEGQVRPRSGLALKHGVTVLNTPGTIDADYRGEIGVILINHGETPFTVRRGERIAQLIIAALVEAALSEVDSLPMSRRGEGGFGSTGSVT